MKKVLFIAMCLVAFAACTSKSSTDSVVNQDSTVVDSLSQIDSVAMTVDTTAVETIN